MEHIRNDILIEAYLKAIDLELDFEFLELLYQELTSRHLHELVPSPTKNMIKIS